MSSLRKIGTAYQIQFRHSGQSKTVTIGSVSASEAKRQQRVLDELLDVAKRGGKLGRELLRSLDSVSESLRERAEALGLVCESEEIPTVSGAIQRYMDAHAGEHSPATKRKWAQALRRAKLYFGELMSVDSVTVGHVREFRMHLLNEQDLSENTTRKTCSDMSAVWCFLIDHEILVSNPWRKVARSVRPSQSREYVSRELIRTVISLANPQLGAMLALARFCGLRIPSEVSGMLWTDVDFDRKRLKVRNVKTAGKTGVESRKCPLFPEAENALKVLKDIRKGISDRVFPRVSENPRTMLLKLLKAKGIEAWPKVFQSLRSSCQTDLSEKHPVWVVCSWLGNTPQVSTAHYLTVTDEHFKSAIG